MKKLLLLLLGVAGGFVLAHYVNKDPRGREVLAEIDARIAEFTDRIGDAYREQETRLSSAVSEAKDAAADAARSATDAVSAAVKDAAAGD